MHRFACGVLIFWDLIHCNKRQRKSKGLSMLGIIIKFIVPEGNTNLLVNNATLTWNCHNVRPVQTVLSRKHCIQFDSLQSISELYEVCRMYCRHQGYARLDFTVFSIYSSYLYILFSNWLHLNALANTHLIHLIDNWYMWCSLRKLFCK